MYTLIEAPGSVPSTYIRLLTTACNSRSRVSDSIFPSMDSACIQCAYTHAGIHIFKTLNKFIFNFNRKRWQRKIIHSIKVQKSIFTFISYQKYIQFLNQAVEYTLLVLTKNNLGIFKNQRNFWQMKWISNCLWNKILILLQEKKNLCLSRVRSYQECLSLCCRIGHNLSLFLNFL